MEECNISDRWQVQIQAMVQVKADVYLYTHGLTDEEVKAAHLKPCHGYFRLGQGAGG